VNKLVGKAILVVALAACGGSSQKVPTSSQAQHAPGPEWVNRGRPSFQGDKPRAFYGVGLASGISNAVMRTATSDARARNEIGKSLDSYVSALERGDGATSGQQNADDPLRKFAQSELPARVQIVDRWVDNDGTEYSLARLDVEAFKGNLDKVKDLDDRTKQQVRANADRAFDELSADEARRQR
jgi:hypothetical protein